jgi:hypothetical protein
MVWVKVDPWDVPNACHLFHPLWRFFIKQGFGMEARAKKENTPVLSTSMQQNFEVDQTDSRRDRTEARTN